MSILNQPVTPGIGPEGLPTPSLPGPEIPSVPSQPDQGQTPGACLCPTGYRASTVQNNQTFTDLLLENDVSYAALRAANPTLPVTRIAPGTRYCAPPAQTRALCSAGAISYVLSQDENLSVLSQRAGLSPGALLTANPMLAPSDFVPGRVVCLP